MCDAIKEEIQGQLFVLIVDFYTMGNILELIRQKIKKFQSIPVLPFMVSVWLSLILKGPIDYFFFEFLGAPLYCMLRIAGKLKSFI